MSFMGMKQHLCVINSTVITSFMKHHINYDVIFLLGLSFKLSKKFEFSEFDGACVIFGHNFIKMDETLPSAL